MHNIRNGDNLNTSEKRILSFIIPCYRSALTIGKVVGDIVGQFATRPDWDYQIILVCDDSPDDTFSVIRKICRSDSQIIGLNLSRNFGQQSARMAALSHVTGKYIVFMDDDGQHPKEGIFELVEKLDEGYDIAYARFRKKQHSLMQQFGSFINRKMTEYLIGKPRNVVASSFFAMKAFVVHELKHYNNPEPYVLGYLMQITKNIANVEMIHQARYAGESGYTLKRLFRLWVQGATSFSVRPLQIASLLGFVCATAGIIFAITIVYQKLTSPNPPATGYPSIMATLLSIGGVIMVLLGMLGEYVGRIFISLNNIPQYVVKESINTDAEPAGSRVMHCSTSLEKGSVLAASENKPRI